MASAATLVMSLRIIRNGMVVPPSHGFLHPITSDGAAQGVLLFPVRAAIIIIGSALLAGRIHRTAFRRFGKQRRQPQTAAGFAVQS